MKFAPLLLIILAVVARAEPVDVLLEAATDAELQPVLSKLEHAQTLTHASWTFWTGTIDGRSVALARTEGDPLNAVAATTLGIRMFAPKLLVTFGTARPLDPSLKAGDVVVSEKFAAFDGIFTPTDTVGGGIHPLKWYKLRHPLMTPGENEKPMEFFPADPDAVARLKSLGDKVHVIEATIGSANQVNREADRIAWVRREWGAATEDAESAHIAGCATLLNTPVAGLRVVDGKPGDAAQLVLKFLEKSK